MKVSKETFFFFIFILIFTSLRSQITITSTSMPGSGDTIRYSLADPTTSVDYQTTGTNITWDFSSVVPIGQGLSEYKSAFNVNPSYLLFFGLSSYGLKIFDSLNLGTFQLSDGYDFYVNNSSEFKAVGRGMEYNGLPGPSFFTDDDEIYKFPLQFGDRDSSTFRVKNDIAGLISFIQKGHRINEVEGWGRVITSFGTFNCLKVKTTIFESDSIVFSSIPLPSVPRTTVEYKWLASSEEIPVFEVSGSLFGGQFTPSLIRYRDKYRNPFTGYERIETHENFKISQLSEFFYVVESPFFGSGESLTLTDISGKFVKAVTGYSGGKYEVDLSEQERGFYLLLIKNSDNPRILKLVRY